jgi:DNA-binding transcriptional ArsR family regulator
MAIHTQTQQLNRAFSALADPTRRAILARLALSEATVSELIAPFKLSQPTISKHLKVLENAGLIERGRDAQRRPRKLVAVALKDVADWVEPFRRQWEGRLDNLERHLAAMSKNTSKKEDQHAAKKPSSRRHQNRD